MKVGDLVKYEFGYQGMTGTVGTILGFPPCTHAKETQKVKVLTKSGIKRWILQYCEKV